LKELERARHAFGASEFKINFDLYTNAALLQLGVNDPARIMVEKLK